eukprot:4456401-Prymnesium_polylepis.1
MLGTVRTRPNVPSLHVATPRTPAQCTEAAHATSPAYRIVGARLIALSWNLQPPPSTVQRVDGRSRGGSGRRGRCVRPPSPRYSISSSDRSSKSIDGIDGGTGNAGALAGGAWATAFSAAALSSAARSAAARSAAALSSAARSAAAFSAAAFSAAAPSLS